MKSFRHLILMLCFTLLFSSCQSVYDDWQPVTGTSKDSNLVPIEDDDEYYTPGTLFVSGDLQSGFLYHDYWIYREVQSYKELSSVSPSGKKAYNGKIAERLVKVNTATGVVSSLCLSPSCNHSPRSGCPMVAPDGWGIYVRVVVGDWIVVELGNNDDVYGMIYESFAYNALTGEKQDILINEYGEMTVTKWAGTSVYGNKLYSIKKYMDYSDTGYVPGGDEPMSSFTPETVCVFSYYDFDTKKTVELFEIPDGYGIYAVTNKRFFFRTSEGEFISCTYDGKNTKKEEVFDFIVLNKIGPYAYFTDNKGFDRYDLKTDTKKRFEIGFSCYQSPTFTKQGIVFDTWTTIDETAEFSKTYKDFAAAHPDLRGMELQDAFMEAYNTVRYSGTAQIWRCDFEGEGLELIFEKENAVIRTVCGNDKYLFGNVFFGDPDNNFKELPYENEARSIINLETGEITPIPLFELIPPSDEMMMEIINSKSTEN